MATENDLMIEDNADEGSAPEVVPAGDTKPVTAPAAPALTAADIASAVAQAMKKPENEGKSAAEVKKDIIDELLSGKEVDVDKSYVAVLKHFQGANKALEAQVKALMERLDGVEGTTGKIAQSAGEQALIAKAGGAEAHAAAKTQALAAAYDIMGVDPEDKNALNDPAFLAVANAQYNKIVAGKGGEAGKPAIPQQKAPSKPITNTKTQAASGNTPADRMAKLRAMSLADD